MEYLKDFEDCTIRQSDLNSLICSLKMDESFYRRSGDPAKAEATERALLQVEHLVSTLRGMHACRKIRELCRTH